MYYAQVGSNGKVHTVSESPSLMVEVNSNDSNVIGTRYDAVSDAFIGFNIVLTADKTSILANGTETATVTATVKTWQGVLATDFVENVVFAVNGAEQMVMPTNGVATLVITADVPDEYLITTVNTGDVMSNGSVTVAATEVA